MHRPLLILDLDETLIFADELPISRPCDFQFEQYYFYKRPYLEEFLREVRESYNIAVWTAASADYAECVLEKIFDEINLEFVWSRKRCTLRMDPENVERFWLKDLKKVKRRGYSLNRTIMVDDYPLSLQRQLGNLVLIHPYIGEENDTELKMLGPYLEWIAKQPNFRSIDKRNWRRLDLQK